MDIHQNNKICHKTELRISTRNLYLSSSKELLTFLSEEFTDTQFDIKNVEGVFDYPEIKNFMTDGNKSGEIYLAKIDDEFGFNLMALRQKEIIDYFDKFDSVFIIPTILLERHNGRLSYCVKKRGEYQGSASSAD